jgi:hypothetical protein
LKVLSACFCFGFCPFAALLSYLGYDNLLTKTYLFFTQGGICHFRRRVCGFGLRESSSRELGLDNFGAGS